MSWIILLLALLLGATLMYLLFKSPKKELPYTNRTKTIVRNCPLCGEGLGSQELVKTVVYPGKQDKLMEIFGCPYCINGSPNKRICPVCKKKLTTDDHIIARLFERVNTKKHVHILGCTQCYTRKN